MPSSRPSVAEIILLLAASTSFAQGTDLIAALANPDPALRWQAVVTLSKAGAPTVPGLIHLLSTGNVQGRENAARVLGRIGEKASSAASALVQALKDPATPVRERAAEALGLLGATSGIPALVLALGDADPYVQGQAAVALGRMGRAAVPSLTIALESTNPSVRKGSITALGRMGGAAVPVLPTLIKALGDADAGVRCGAVIALGEVGSLGKTAAPAVRERLHDADEEVRWAAGWALERLGAEPGPGAVETLKALTPALMKALKVPGVSIAVIQDRKVSWSGAFGQAQVPDGRLVAEDTVFEACSMSKVVFAYLVLKLVDRGMLDLDRPLCHYLDEAAIPTQAERRLITARMVLSHTSGLPNWRKGGEETEGPLPVKFRPGSRFSYSGEGMFYLQRVLEHLADEPLELLAERTLFRPLGMGHTSFVWTPALGPRLAAGHKADGTFKERTQYLHANAAYSLYTTPKDFAAFLLAFLNPPGAGTAALSSASLKACLTPQVFLDAREPMERPGAARGQGVGWGLGWSINTTATGTLFHHSGANSSGFRCFSQFDPARGTGLVIMTNGMAGGELWTRLVSQVGDL